jgi:Domain of unknown function (DUF4333)
MKALLPLLAGALVVVALGGCGETVLDSAKTEEQLESSLEKSSLPRNVANEIGVSPDEKVSSVECPSGQEVEAGAVFTCTITFANGAKATEHLKIVNKDADVNALGLSPSK